MIGILICFFISCMAFASSMSVIAILTISHLAFSNSLICLMLASISLVKVLVIDCTAIGLSPPINLLPTFITFVFLRYTNLTFSQNKFNYIFISYKYHQTK